jgi:flagellar biosynthesis protein
MEHPIPENDQAWTAEGDNPREGTGTVPSRREQTGLPLPSGGNNHHLASATNGKQRQAVGVAVDGRSPRSGTGDDRPRAGTGDDRRRAVALTYDAAKMQAPTVSAIGYGLVADRIIDLAREHDVPIRPDADLTALLTQLEVGQIIPPELYPLVAEVLAFVYRLRRQSAARLK